LERRFQGKGSSLWNIFHILHKLHRATCRRFDTIPACDRQTDRQTDGQTDGIAVASTALALRALRRAVKMLGIRVFARMCDGGKG